MSKTGYTREHPVIRCIEKIVKSDDGKTAARQAADAERSALAGVGRIIREKLGDQYGPVETTSWAGYFVAEVMRDFRYKQDGERPLQSCVANSGAFFKAE